MGNCLAKPPPVVLVPPLFDYPPLSARNRMLESSYDLLFGKLALKCLFEDYFEVKDADHFSAKFMLKPTDDPHVDLVASVSSAVDGKVEGDASFRWQRDLSLSKIKNLQPLSTSSSPICSGGCQSGAWSPEASPSPFPLFILLRLCPLSPTRRDAWSSGRSSAAGSLICSGEVRSVVDPVVAFGLEACGGVVDSLPVVVVFVVSKSVLRCGEEYRASLSFRLVVLSIGQSDSFLLREARCFKLSGSVAAVASACSFRVAFHALCGVNYKPGFGGFARSRGKYLDLPSIARLALHDSEGYMLRGVHRELATPETTQEFPASEATRRTSHFCDSSSMFEFGYFVQSGFVTGSDLPVFADLSVSTTNPVLRVRSSGFYPKYGIGAFVVSPLISKKNDKLSDEHGIVGLRYASTNLSLGAIVSPFSTKEEWPKNAWLVRKMGRLTVGVQYGRYMENIKDTEKYRDLRNWSCAASYGLGSRSPLGHLVDDSNTSNSLSDSSLQMAASWQANKNFLLKGKVGALSSTLTLAFKSWWNPSFTFNITATNNHRTGRTACGFGLRVDNLREARSVQSLFICFHISMFCIFLIIKSPDICSYQRADPNFVMLTPNKEHLADGIVWKMGQRPMLQSDLDAENFKTTLNAFQPPQQFDAEGILVDEAAKERLKQVLVSLKAFTFLLQDN
ncbi:unnamed protein product [Brassica rapa]|uniref:Uncharacterized protein n=2 Tax=Brassica TaxID=3705 RepID=A0A8D9H9V1_BRACM|nr:unnamed protein product [Brassica napus]CAG7895426.1 unnamed protein product [Brassica rapa]